MIPDFYTRDPAWVGRIEHIISLLGRISAFEEMSPQKLEMRRASLIESVHSSTAIEGNRLTLAQARGIAKGDPVVAPARDVKEFENGLAAYEALDTYDPWSIEDFLRAHGLLTSGLVTESGAFRTVDVEIVNAEGDVLHTGSSSDKVPRLIAELLEWGSASIDHPIIVASAVHFLIEYIHPFRDGNGRIGRLWQTLIQSRWQATLGHVPTESLVRKRQADYYVALQTSHDPQIDAAPFITYMLGVITESLTIHEQHARSTDGVGANDGLNVGVKTPEAVLALLRDDPTLTAAVLAKALGKSKRTIERQLTALKAAGRLRREGSDKTGRWVVVD